MYPIPAGFCRPPLIPAEVTQLAPRQGATEGVARAGRQRKTRTADVVGRGANLVELNFAGKYTPCHELTVHRWEVTSQSSYFVE